VVQSNQAGGAPCTAPTNLCANDLIDPGSFTARVTGAAATILESNSATYSWNCGSAVTLLSCQVAQRLSLAGVVAVVPGNSFHVALVAGSTFGIVGSASPAITVSVVWTPFPISVTVGDVPFTVGSFLIPIVAPVYALSLVANPATIPAALPTSTNTPGSVITAILYHVQTTAACVVINTAFTAPALATYACNAPGALAGAVAGAAGFLLAPGAESGTVTFQTNLGVFASVGAIPAGPSLVSVTGAAQIVSAHCGTLPNTFPTNLIPTPGLVTTLTLNSCQTVSATLVGGGSAGTATVIANFVGDFTGAQPGTQGEVTVNLTPGPITVALTTGCNEVLTPPALAAGSTGTQVAALASGFNVTSIWVFNNGTHTFMALYFPGNAPTDISSVGPNQSVFICGTGTGTFRVA